MLTRPDPEHPTKKLYVCQYCPKTFRKPSALQPHIFSHTGEKPYICHIHNCNRRYSTLSNLRRHFKAHNKNKRSVLSSSSDVTRKYRRRPNPVGDGNTDNVRSHDNIDMTCPSTAPGATVAAAPVSTIPPSLSVFSHTTATLAVDFPPQSVQPVWPSSSRVLLLPTELMPDVNDSVLTCYHDRCLTPTAMTTDPSLLGCEEWSAVRPLSMDYYFNFMFMNRVYWST